MNKKQYNDIANYIQYRTIPKNVSSKSNFRAVARKYKINSVGSLERDNKPVALKSELGDIWYHFFLII